MDVAILITVKHLCWVGITLWAAFVGGVDFGGVDVTLLCHGGQELKVGVKCDGLLGGLGNCSSSVLDSGQFRNASHSILEALALMGFHNLVLALVIAEGDLLLPMK